MHSVSGVTPTVCVCVHVVPFPVITFVQKGDLNLLLAVSQ